MASLFTEKKIFAKEQVRFMKFGNVFEFFSLDNKKLGEAREEEIDGIKKVFKLTKYKQHFPFTVSIYDSSDKKLVTIRRGFSLFLSTVKVFDGNGSPIGHYKQKFKLLKSKFLLFDESEKHFADLDGTMIGWSYAITDIHGTKLGGLYKKFSGVGKELFTTADNYIIELENISSLSENQRKMIISVACIIDMIAGERS
ncbi:hypothetical protein HYS47_03810 [Candidatus Woesearchaeota archaeon]|nr:hypothetical protein [Candidatus Woesearchaeota archaeon]